MALNFNGNDVAATPSGEIFKIETVTFESNKLIPEGLEKVAITLVQPNTQPDFLPVAIFNVDMGISVALMEFGIIKGTDGKYSVSVAYCNLSADEITVNGTITVLWVKSNLINN